MVKQTFRKIVISQRLPIPAAKTGERLVGPQISLLHGILRILVVAEKPAGKVIGGIQMGQENLLKVGLAQISLPS